ncbi:MAG: hypothetical protein ABI584_15695 [Acidobacteriota bacterium]
MTAVLSLVRLTTNPAGGATLEIVTVPVEGVPPLNTVGLSETLERIGGLIVRVAAFVTAAAVAEIVTDVRLPTPTVTTENVAVATPPGTVMLAGTDAQPLSFVRLTTKPPAGAMLESVTVPVEGVPPVTVVGLSETPARTGGLMVRVAVFVMTPALAVSVAVVADPTAAVATVNAAVVAPAATDTIAGTIAEPLLLESVTASPPDGAGTETVTVPVADAPPVTLDGATPSAKRFAEPAPFPTRSAHTCPSERVIAKPVTVCPCRLTDSEGTSSRTHAPVAGRAPIEVLGVYPRRSGPQYARWLQSPTSSLN